MIKSRVIKAYNLAEELHKEQFRKFSGLPYFVHPKNVARIIEDLKKDEDMIICALLHDTVEDCGVSLTYIEEQFGSKVVGIIKELTTVKREGVSKLDLLCEKIENMSDEALTIKLVDRFDNVRYMDKDCNTLEQKNFVKRYYNETILYVDFIKNGRKNTTKVQKLLLEMINNQLRYIEIKYLWD